MHDQSSRWSPSSYRRLSLDSSKSNWKRVASIKETHKYIPDRSSTCAWHFVILLLLSNNSFFSLLLIRGLRRLIALQMMINVCCGDDSLTACKLVYVLVECEFVLWGGRKVETKVKIKYSTWRAGKFTSNNELRCNASDKKTRVMEWLEEEDDWVSFHIHIIRLAASSGGWLSVW